MKRWSIIPRAALWTLCLLLLCVSAAAAPEDGEGYTEEGYTEEDYLAENAPGSVEIAPAVNPYRLYEDFTSYDAADQRRSVAPVAPVVTADVDPRTGAERETEVEGETREFYPLSQGRFGYDKINHVYTNFFGSSSFTSTVPNGAIVSRGTHVSFQMPAGAGAMLYRDGDLVTEADLSDIAEVGDYYLSVQGGQSGANTRFDFRIVNDITNNFSEMSLPEGFTFTGVYLDGEQIQLDYDNYYDFLLDGKYRVVWGCEPIGQSYELTFTRDTETPALTISGLSNETTMEANGPVTLSWEDENAYVIVRTEGKDQRIGTPPTEIKQAGEYTVTICDTAGNSASYDFIIHVYLNLSAYAAIALVLFGVALVLAYCRRVKKHSRVG